MAMHIEPRFSANVKVKDLEGSLLLERNFSSVDEAIKFTQKYSASERGWSVLAGALCPQRTDSWQHFASDLLLPTFIHSALKVNNLAVRIVASAFAIVADVVTLPVRILFTPLKVAIDYYKPTSPNSLRELLAMNTRDLPKVVQMDIKVSDWREGQSRYRRDRWVSTARQITATGSVRIALEPLPGFESESEFRCKRVTFEKWDGPTGGWQSDGHSDVSTPNCLIQGTEFLKWFQFFS